MWCVVYIHVCTGVGGSDDIDDIITELDRVKLFSETVDQIMANYCHLCKPVRSFHGRREREKRRSRD